MYKYEPLERVSPAESGLRSDKISELIKKLQSMSEMHGIIIAKNGKICAEGYWKPYTAQLRHCLWSQSKSYTISAVGALIDEGKLGLEEKVSDILSKYMPDEMNDDLKNMTVEDLMTMRSGQHGEQSRVSKTWEKDFFSGEFYGTGKDFGYSGICSSLLGVIVKEKTGLGLLEFLRGRVFDKIGIDTDSLKCMEHADKIEYGGGGFMTKAEDSLRLGLLYLNGGMWNGERVLSEKFITAATTKRTETTNDYSIDTGCGYGYQIWMCKPEGVYRFDGAFGQYVIVDPKQNIVISIMQRGGGQAQLDVIWEYLSNAAGNTAQYDALLADELSRLSLPAPNCLPVSARQKELLGKKFEFPKNDIYLFSPMVAVFSPKIPKGIQSISFSEKDGELTADVIYGSKPYTLHISTDGAYRLSDMYTEPDLPELVYANGYWKDSATFSFSLCFIEGAFTTEHTLKLCENSKIRLYHSESKPMNMRGSEPKETFIESL